MLTVIYTTLLQGTRLSHLFMKFLTCFNALSAGDHSCQRDGGPRDPTVQLHWSPEKWPGVWAHLQQKVSQRKGTDHSKCHISCLCMYWILNIILQLQWSQFFFYLALPRGRWKLVDSSFWLIIRYFLSFPKLLKLIWVGSGIIHSGFRKLLSSKVKFFPWLDGWK